MFVYNFLGHSWMCNYELIGVFNLFTRITVQRPLHENNQQHDYYLLQIT